MSAPQIPPAQVPQTPGAGLSRRFRMGRTVMALMLREMSTRYGRSPGGYLWAVLEPLGMIIILSLGFSLLVRTPPLGTSFTLFFATGFVPFNLYMTLSSTVMRTINFSRALLSYPVVTWVDAIAARFVLNSLTGIMVGYIIIAALLALSETRISVEAYPLLECLGLTLLLGLSVGTLNCALIGLLQIWDQIWSIAMRPLFLASGVIFIYEDMPEVAQNILWYNPLLHVVGLMRSGLYPTYEADYVSGWFVVAVSLGTLFMGVVLLGRYHRDILNN